MPGTAPAANLQVTDMARLPGCLAVSRQRCRSTSADRGGVCVGATLGLATQKGSATPCNPMAQAAVCLTEPAGVNRCKLEEAGARRSCSPSSWQTPSRGVPGLPCTQPAAVIQWLGWCQGGWGRRTSLFRLLWGCGHCRLQGCGKEGCGEQGGPQPQSHTPACVVEVGVHCNKVSSGCAPRIPPSWLAPT